MKKMPVSYYTPNVDREQVDIQITPAQPGWTLIQFFDMRESNDKPLTRGDIDHDEDPIVAWRVITMRRLQDRNQPGDDPTSLRSYAEPVTLADDEYDGFFVIKGPDTEYLWVGHVRYPTLEAATDGYIKYLKGLTGDE